MCLIWPDDKPNDHAVEVELDSNRTVAVLKELIKDAHAPMLDKVAARNLVLWKCSGLPDDDDKLEQTLKTLRFEESEDRLVRLTGSARRQISHYFGDEDLSKEPIHILVEVPALGGCGSRICYSMLKGLMSNVQPRQGEHA
jgi:hypothetical protein